MTARCDALGAMHRARNVMLMAADASKFDGEQKRLREKAEELREARTRLLELVEASWELQAAMIDTDPMRLALAIKRHADAAQNVGGA